MKKRNLSLALVVLAVVFAFSAQSAPIIEPLEVGSTTYIDPYDKVTRTDPGPVTDFVSLLFSTPGDYQIDSVSVTFSIFELSGSITAPHTFTVVDELIVDIFGGYGVGMDMGPTSFGYVPAKDGAKLEVSSIGIEGLFNRNPFAFDYAAAPGQPSLWTAQLASNTAAPVPEPATMLLFGFGAVGLGLVNRRKKK